MSGLSKLFSRNSKSQDQGYQAAKGSENKDKNWGLWKKSMNKLSMGSLYSDSKSAHNIWKANRDTGNNSFVDADMNVVEMHEFPDSSKIKKVLGKDSGKYACYGEMLNAIDDLNKTIDLYDKFGSEAAYFKEGLVAQYANAIAAMRNYYEEMSKDSSSASGREKRKTRREYIKVLYDFAVSDLSQIRNNTDGESPEAMIANARTETLEDKDFTGVIKGGNNNQVYQYNQGFFKAEKKDNVFTKTETSLMDTIGIDHSENADTHMGKREVASARLDMLLGGGVIGSAKMATVQDNTALTGKSFSRITDEGKEDTRTFNAGSGTSGVVSATAKGKAYTMYNWETMEVNADTLGFDKNRGMTIKERLISDKIREAQKNKASEREISKLQEKKNNTDLQKSSELIGRRVVEGVGGKKDQTLNANDPKFQRDMNTLFLLDTLALQTDRHSGNFFIEADENGNYKGLTGIDNDISFGTRESAYGKKEANYSGLPKQMLIDRKVADKIRAVKKPELKWYFGDLLSEQEIEALWSRFQKLSTYIDEMESKNLLVDKWNEETAVKQVMMSEGFMGKVGMDYYTRHITALNLMQSSRDRSGDSVNKLVTLSNF